MRQEEKIQKKHINRESKERGGGDGKQVMGRGQGLCVEVRMQGYGLVPGEVLEKITVTHK